MCPQKMLFSFSKYETKNNTCNSFLPNIPCHNNTIIMYTVTFSIIIVKFPSHGIVLTVYNKPYKNNLVVRTTYSQQRIQTSLTMRGKSIQQVVFLEKHLGMGSSLLFQVAVETKALHTQLKILRFFSQSTSRLKFCDGDVNRQNFTEEACIYSAIHKSTGGFFTKVMNSLFASYS